MAAGLGHGGTIPAAAAQRGTAAGAAVRAGRYVDLSTNRSFRQIFRAATLAPSSQVLRRPYDFEGFTMPGRGPQTFKKRQKEQQRKERQQEKMEKRLRRKELGPASLADPDSEVPSWAPGT